MNFGELIGGMGLGACRELGVNMIKHNVWNSQWLIKLEERKI